MIQVTKTVALDERDIEERFVRAAGARGQNLHREATAVELRLDVAASSLPPEVKDLLFAQSGRSLTTNGVLVVVSRVYRSQARNRDAARARLVTLLQRALKVPTTRKSTTPRAAVREARLVSKKRRGAAKVSRG